MLIEGWGVTRVFIKRNEQLKARAKDYRQPGFRTEGLLLFVTNMIYGVMIYKVKLSDLQAWH